MRSSEDEKVSAEDAVSGVLRKIRGEGVLEYGQGREDGTASKVLQLRLAKKSLTGRFFDRDPPTLKSVRIWRTWRESQDGEARSIFWEMGDLFEVPFFPSIYMGRVVVIHAMAVGHFQKECKNHAGDNLIPHL